MNVIPMIPRRLPNGFLLQVFPAAPEVGGLDLIVWRNAARDDGFLVAGLPDLSAVRKCIADMQACLK